MGPFVGCKIMFLSNPPTKKKTSTYVGTYPYIPYVGNLGKSATQKYPLLRDMLVPRVNLFSGPAL